MHLRRLWPAASPTSQLHAPGSQPNDSLCLARSEHFINEIVSLYPVAIYSTARAGRVSNAAAMLSPSGAIPHQPIRVWRRCLSTAPTEDSIRAPRSWCSDRPTSCTPARNRRAVRLLRWEVAAVWRPSTDSVPRFPLSLQLLRGANYVCQPRRYLSRLGPSALLASSSHIVSPTFLQCYPSL